ncbi:MAG TPA: bifunctional oligoribonuclease/PAP phosphatase NrnA [Bacteroidales bacterium]|nr:bifunctional oligoribonuclease/PAP phosphatase NrnA [Bacteroidales bacterium]
MRKSSGKYIKELSKLIDESGTIGLICHINPDGDAIGSMLSLYHYLTGKAKVCKMISPNGLQEFLLWMKGTEYITNAELEPGKALASIKESDLIILLDFNHPSRIGRLDNYLRDNKRKIVLIDHHPVPEVEADLVISEPSLSSTAELILELVMHLDGNSYYNRDFFESVYVGMMTDTGNFNFGSFDGNTLRNVANMLDFGLDKDYITNRIYNNFSASRMKLMGFALYERMIVLEGYNTAYIYLLREDLDRFNHSSGDTEGFVNLPLTIEGVVFSLLFIEKEDNIKLSMRSKGKFEVNTFAEKYFDGGGHRNAAGGRSPLHIHECLSYFESLLPEIKEQLNEISREIK